MNKVLLSIFIFILISCQTIESEYQLQPLTTVNSDIEFKAEFVPSKPLIETLQTLGNNYSKLMEKYLKALDYLRLDRILIGEYEEAKMIEKIISNFK